MLTSRTRAQLLIIDVQEKLQPHIHEGTRVLANVVRLLGYAKRLGVPALVTEHCPDALGASVPALRALSGNGVATMAKTTFSCWREPAIRAELRRRRGEGRDQIVVAGCESHVCVLQSTIDLLAEGFDVFLVGDATGSRAPEIRDLALARLAGAGAAVVSHEMVAFEWLERAGTPEFKDLIGVIK
jgi:nicotinamidase-related amidase